MNILIIEDEPVIAKHLLRQIGQIVKEQLDKVTWLDNIDDAEQAIKAFEYGVLDFVAKPFNLERLQQAIDRFFHQRQHSQYACRYLSIKKAGQIELVATEQVDYINASGHYSELYCNGNTFLHDKSIERISSILPGNFERVHRSYIVNMNKVKRLEPGSKYSLQLHNLTSIPVIVFPTILYGLLFY